MSYIWPWLKMNMVPLYGLEAWHTDDNSIADNGVMPELINGRNATTGSSKPVLTELPDLNDQRGWYFDGTMNPMTWSGNLTLKHVFMVVSFADDSFSESRGVMTGLTTGDVIVTEAVGSSLGRAGGSTVGVNGGLDQDSAPVSGVFGVIEVVSSLGIAVDGIQIGALRNTGSGKHYGYVCDSLAYSRVLSDLEKIMVRRYIAGRYHIWEQVA